MKKTILSLLFAVLASLAVLAQNVTVRGTVVSAADSEPLIGAGVVPQGAGGKGVVTEKALALWDFMRRFAQELSILTYPPIS